MAKKDLHIVSFSGGKDSTAMLLKMLEKQMPVDIILFCDTGLEFPAMYEHIAKVEQNIGMPITRVKPAHSFEYYLLEAEIKHKNEQEFIREYGGLYRGMSWSGAKARWCTSRLKDKPREDFLRPLNKEYNIIMYIAFAADEKYRLTRKSNQKKNYVYPLMEWNMTEADCLNYCYDKGYDWNGLYKQFRRVSCWCCPLQPLDELRVLWRNYPQLWEQLKFWDFQTWRKFRKDYSVFELGVRFNFECECRLRGKPITGKAFYSELRERIAEENSRLLKKFGCSKAVKGMDNRDKSEIYPR